MPIYYYPEDIKDAKYRDRRVKISVMKPNAQLSVSEAERNAFNTLQKATDFVVAASSTVSDIAKNLNANSRGNEGETVDTLVLPLPNTFVDSQSHGWSLETGILGTIGKNVLSTDVGGAAGGFLGNIAAKVAGNTVGGAVNTITNPLSGITFDKFLGAKSSATGLRKQIIDPGYFQNYSGSEPRTFEMEFDLVPKNAAEAEQIMLIIMKLKQYSSPSRVTGGVSVLAPYFFNIDISNEYINAMSNFDRVVLTSISVDYGADGAMQQHADGVPKYMKLNLSWAEVDMTTMQDYNSLPRKPGVN